jgi:hypothetical protein
LARFYRPGARRRAATPLAAADPSAVAAPLHVDVKAVQAHLDEEDIELLLLAA